MLGEDRRVKSNKLLTSYVVWLAAPAFSVYHQNGWKQAVAAKTYDELLHRTDTKQKG